MKKVLRVKGRPGKEPGYSAELASSSQHLKTMSGAVVITEKISVLTAEVPGLSPGGSTHW